MILIIFKLIIFWSILFFFGYQVAKWLIKEKKKEVIFTFSGLIGAGLYVFFINAIGYFIPIKVTFYLVLLLFTIIAIALFFINKKDNLEWGIDKKWRKILLFTFLALTTITFIVDNRYLLGGDQLLPPCMPSAATMAEGNFPPKAIWTPPYPLRYHYGPHLFAAAIYKTTGLPLYASYDIQVAISIAILFLLGFILIKKLDKTNKEALISSFLMIFTGSLVFLKGIKGIPVLYDKYFLHQNIVAPFKFVFETFEGIFSAPAFQRAIEYPIHALGFILMMAIIYLYLHSERIDKKIILLNILFLSTLALVSEALFVVFCFLLVAYPFIFGLIKKDWLKAKIFLVSSLLILIIALPIAFIQGGVFTHYLGLDGHNLNIARLWGYTNTEFLDRGFEINKAPWILMTRLGGKNSELPIYNLEFLLQWGLLFCLVVMAIVYFWKNQSKYLLFLTSSFLIFFLIPLFVLFPLIYSATERFFYPANLFGGLIVGLFLTDLFFKEKNIKKKFLRNSIIFVSIILITQALIFLFIFLTIGYPPGRWSNASELFPVKDSFEGKIYQWVKKYTTINDYFLILESEKNNYGLEDKSPNLRFILNTGRIAPNYTYHTSEGPVLVPEPYAFKIIKEKCESKLIKELNYKYLYVTQDYPLGLEQKCLKNNKLELKFEAREGDKFVRIYKINY